MARVEGEEGREKRGRGLVGWRVEMRLCCWEVDVLVELVVGFAKWDGMETRLMRSCPSMYLGVSLKVYIPEISSKEHLTAKQL